MSDLSEPLLPLNTIKGKSWVSDPAVWGSIGNLSMTTVGAEVLSLPAAVATTGWLLGTFLLVLFAGMADLSNIFLLRCGKASGLDDYEKIGRAYLGRWGGLAVRVSLVLLLLGALTSVNVIVVDMVSSNMGYFSLDGQWFNSRIFISFMNIFLMWPLCLLAQVYQLRHVSLLAFGSVVYVLVSVCIMCTLDLVDPQDRPYADASTAPGEVQTLTLGRRSFLALPVMAMAYCAQFQVLPVYHSLPTQSREHMNLIIHMSYFGVAMPIYIGFAVLPYLVIGSHVNSDFLFTAWQSSRLMASARVLLAIVNMLKYPLVAMPLRDILLDLGWKGHDPQDVTWRERMLVMCVINMFVFLGTLYASGLGEVVDLIGSSSGSLVCFVFPSLLFLYMSSLPRPLSCASLVEQHAQELGQEPPSFRWSLLKVTTWYHLAAGIMFVAGLGLGAIAFIFTLTLDPL